MTEAVYEGTCTWPDGQQRRVVLGDNDGKRCAILWNETFAYADDKESSRVVVMEDKVPISWISDVREMQ